VPSTSTVEKYSSFCVRSSGRLTESFSWGLLKTQFNHDNVQFEFLQSMIRIAADAHSLANGLNNYIDRFTPDGVGSLFATLSGGPEYLAFQPSSSAVPEPSGLVLLGIGGSILLTVVGRIKTRPSRAMSRSQTKNGTGRFLI
jgi:hypothetical protein